MPLAYRQVKDLYDTLQAVGVTDKSLPDWATEMNRITNSDLYGAGLHDNFIKRASVGIDRLLESSGLTTLGREFGRGVGESVGAPEAGANIGEGLPRSTLNFAPLFIPGVGWGAAAARLGLTGLLSGAETYTSTGSPAAGTISGLTAAALPGVTGKIESVAARALGAPVVKGAISDELGNVINRLNVAIPETFTQKAGTFVAGQLGAAGVMEGSKATQNLVTGQEQVNPFSVENLLNLTLGQLPFAAIHGARKAIGAKGPTAGELQHAIDVSTSLIEQKRASDRAARETPIESLPDVVRDETVSAQVVKETQTRLAQIRGEQVDIKDDPALTPEQKFDATNALLREETDLMRQREGVEPSARSVFGDSIVEDTPRQQVVGHELRSTAKWRAILVDDIPVNPPELRGKVVSYSTAYEPNPTRRSTGDSVYGLPPKQWQTVKTQEEWNVRSPKVDPLQPDLPVRPEEATRAQMFAHLENLKKVEISADAAKTPLDFQQAVVRLQDVEHQNGLQPTSDAELRREADTIEKTGTIPVQDVPKVAVKARAKKVARRIQEQAVPTLTPEEAADISAKMGAGGFSVITADKLSHTEPSNTPFNDLVTEKAYGVTHGDLATKPEDVNMFRTLIEHLGTLPEPGMTEEISDVAKFIAERDGVTVAEAKDEVNHFITLPHVQQWGKTLDEQVAKLRETNAAPGRPAMPAGKDWLFSMGPFDPTTNTLNFKHRLPNDGNVVVEQFRNMAGVGKPLAKAEVELYQSLVPEAFEGGKVNVPKLVEGLKVKGPVVEVRKLGDKASGTNRMEQIQHELDTSGYAPIYDDNGKMVRIQTPDGRNYTFDQLDTIPSTIRDQINELRQLEALPPHANVPARPQGAESRYSFLGPKPESEMSGYVEGLVRVPQKKETVSWKDVPKERKGIRSNAQGGMLGTVDIQDKPLYTGSHFGSEDTNVLSFYRGYEETLPDGTKAFHVIEVQSDWGQQERDKVKQNQELRGTDKGPWKEISHPLLRVYESLALKAAIAHAKEIGATKVILSDAETAMMTEGHDRAVTEARPVTLAELQKKMNYTSPQMVRHYGEDWQNGKFVEYQGTTYRVDKPNLDLDREIATKLQPFVDKAGYPEPPQSAGMRLHYDQTLPSAMEKLTGVKGQDVSLGTHKNAETVLPQPIEYTNLQNALHNGIIDQAEYERRIAEVEQASQAVQGSPVFRDSSGNPKTQITGRLYNISHLPGDFTLTDPNRAPDWTSIEPESERDASLMTKVGTDGNSGLKFLIDQGEIPQFKAMAKDLAKFTDSLGRIDLAVGKTNMGTSFARDMGNGRVQAVVSDASMNFRAVFEFHLLHEITHGLSLVELNNPTNVGIRTEIENIRQKLADTLPTKLKDQLGFLERTQWREQYKSGQTPFETIFPGGTDAERAVLYALTSTNEFVAQGLSSRSVMSYMRGIKTKEGSWFSRFTNTIKQLLGVGPATPNNVFEEFLSKTDQLLDRGNYVSSFRDFSDRYFENLGQSEGEVQVNTRRALGVLLNNRFDTTARDILYQLADTNLIRSSDVGTAQRDLTQAFNTKGEPFEEIHGILNELGHPTTLQGVSDFTHQALIEPVVEHQTALDIMPQEMFNYVMAKTKDMNNVLGVLKAASDEKNKGLINIVDPKMLAGPVQEAAKLVGSLLDAQTRRADAESTVRGLASIEPSGFLRQYLGEHAPGNDEVQDKILDTEPKERSRLKNWFQQIGQFAMESPEAAEVLALGTTLEARAHDMAQNALRPLGVGNLAENGTSSNKEGVKMFSKLLSNKSFENAANRWTVLSNKKGKDKVTMLPSSDPDVQKLLSKFSEKDKKSIEDIVFKRSVSMQVHQQDILSNMLELATTDGAKLVLTDGSISKMSQATQLVGRLVNAVMADRTDPNAARVADADMNLIQSKMTPEGFLGVLKYTQGEVTKYNFWKQHFINNPDWASFQRQEQYLIEYIKNGNLVQNQGSSIKEVLAKAEGYKIVKQPWDQWKERGDKPVDFERLTPEDAARLQELDQNQINILKSKGIPSEYLDVIKQFGAGQQFIREAAATQGIENFRAPSRNLSKGAEELPVMWNHISYIEQSARLWSRRLYRAKYEGYLMEPETQQNPQMLADLRQNMENMLQPDPQLISKLNKFTATWQMGLSPATAMVIGTHGLIRQTAQFTSMTGSPIDSFRRTGSAVAEVARQVVRAMSGKDWADPEHSWLMKQASKDRQIEQDWYDDSLSNEGPSLNFKRALMKNKVQTVGQRLGTLAGSASNASMLMVQGARRTQEQIALLSAFDYHREQGLSMEEAKVKAYQFNEATNPVGGRAQRPIGAFAGEGSVARGIAMLGFNMKSYVLGTVGQLARHIQTGYFRPAGDITPNEMYNARKATVQMIGTQLFAAGLLGLPGVTAALSLINQVFPSLEVNKKLRETAAEFFNGDKQNGSVWSDIAMTGVPSMIGWDWQSRLSMGNIVPGVQENNGFQPELLLGPSASLVTNWVNGVKRVGGGDLGGTISFLPPGIKKLVGFLADDGVERDYKDRPIFTPNTTETAGLALGFQPKRLSDFNVASRILDQSSKVANQQTNQEHRQLASEALKGNFGTVRQALLAKAQQDHNYDPRSGVKAVSREAEALTFPRDLTREGTLTQSPARASLLRALNVTPSAGASEVDRLKFRQEIERRLGVVPTSNQELATAMLVDQLRSRYPDESRVQLRNRAGQMLHVSRTQSLLPE